MNPNDKIYVSEYLKDLNKNVKYEIAYHNLKKDSVSPLTCKELAKNCGVTQSTITNLSTSSKYYLIDKIASEILDAYYGYFIQDEYNAKKEYPDEIIYPRDKNYIIMYLTNYYTDEFFKYKD